MRIITELKKENICSPDQWWKECNMRWKLIWAFYQYVYIVLRKLHLNGWWTTLCYMWTIKSFLWCRVTIYLSRWRCRQHQASIKMMSLLNLEECELLGDSKYRAYISQVEKALKNFESTSEWADLISALGKLNKVRNKLKFVIAVSYWYYATVIGLQQSVEG